MLIIKMDLRNQMSFLLQFLLLFKKFVQSKNLFLLNLITKVAESTFCSLFTCY